MATVANGQGRWRKGRSDWPCGWLLSPGRFWVSRMFCGHLSSLPRSAELSKWRNNQIGIPNCQREFLTGININVGPPPGDGLPYADGYPCKSGAQSSCGSSASSVGPEGLVYGLLRAYPLGHVRTCRH